MDEAKARFELIRAEDDWTDEAVAEMAMMLAHEKAVEELATSGTHGHWSDDPEAMAERDAWLNALEQFLPRLEKGMLARGMTFTPYRPFKERQADVF